MQPHWPIIAAISGHPTIANGSAISIDRHISGPMDSNSMLISALTPGGYVRPTLSSNVLPGSSIPSAPGGYNAHHNLAYPFPHSFSVGAHQSMEPPIAGRQFPNATINPSFHLQHFQQPASQQLPLPHAPVPYGQSLSYLSPSLVTAMGNGNLGHIQQTYANVPSQAPLAVNMTAHCRTFDSLKHFGAAPQTQHGRRNKSTVTSKTNLYISGLSESDTDDTVRSLVENIVQPKSCKAMVVNGKCRGSGFIDCASEEDAEKAKAHILECAKNNGRKLSVKYAYENEKDLLNVYVRNLPREGFTKEMLENLFQKFGHVTSVKLLETSTGFTGIGFVRFATAEQAEKAVEQMNEAKHIVRGGDKPITCKLADKADPKRRNATSNPQALVAAAAAAGLHPQIPVGSHINRTTHGLPGLASLQALGQAQQPSFNPQFPLTAQLVQPLQQTPVVVPNLHSSGVSSQNRNVLLSSALLQNGPSGNAISASFPNGGNCHQNVSTTSYRTNLVGIQPAIPANQTATVVAGYNDSPFNRSKSCINVQSGSHSANNPPIYTANGNTSQSAHGTFQSLTTYGSPTTSSYQGGLSYVHHQSQQIPAVPTTVASGSQMVVVTPTPPAPISSSSGLYQSVSSSSSSSLAAAAASNGSVSANFPTSSSSGVSHQKSLLSSNVPSAVCQVQNLQCSLPETTNLNTVGLMTSEFQGMSFNSTVNNTSPPSSSTCQSDNVVSSCDTQVWSNDGDGQKLCPMNSINSSESDIMPCQQQQQTTGIENTSHGDLVVVATENTVKSNVTEPTTDTHHCSNFQQETIPSSDFDCLSSLPSGEVPSSLDPPPPPSTNHSSASSSTTCQTGNCLSSPNLEMNGSSRRLGGGGGGSSSSSTECQSDDKLLRKSKLADKKRDSSSNSTASGRRCSEAGLNETTASPTSTTTIPLNRRKKNPHSAAAAVASSVSNKQPPPPAQKHSKSPPKKDTTVSGGSSEVRLPTSCTLLNPSSP